MRFTLTLLPFFSAITLSSATYGSSYTGSLSTRSASGGHIITPRFMYHALSSLSEDEFDIVARGILERRKGGGKGGGGRSAKGHSGRTRKKGAPKLAAKGKGKGKKSNKGNKKKQGCQNEQKCKAIGDVAQEVGKEVVKQGVDQAQAQQQ